MYTEKELYTSIPRFTNIIRSKKTVRKVKIRKSKNEIPINFNVKNSD
jgi:hypothetical protein